MPQFPCNMPSCMASLTIIPLRTWLWLELKPTFVLATAWSTLWVEGFFVFFFQNCLQKVCECFNGPACGNSFSTSFLLSTKPQLTSMQCCVWGRSCFLSWIEPWLLPQNPVEMVSLEKYPCAQKVFRCTLYSLFILYFISFQYQYAYFSKTRQLL